MEGDDREWKTRASSIRAALSNDVAVVTSALVVYRNSESTSSKNG